MKATYEKRKVDFYYRDDKGGTVVLGCRPHLHYHVEIVYMIEGEMCAHIDSDEYHVQSGDMLIVFPNKVHRFIDLQKGNKYKLFIINPNLVPEFESQMSSSSPSNPLIKNARENVRLDSVVNIVADSKNFPEAQRDSLMKGYLLSFFAEFLSMIELDANKPDESQAVKTVVLYCSQNFTKELSLSTLEDELHLSRYYISHLFGDKLGVRFNDYINSLRISEACRMLRTTDKSMTEVCDSSGFGTLRTFNRAFVKQVGVSPSDYRKNHKGKYLDASIPPVSVTDVESTAPEKKTVEVPQYNSQTAPSCAANYDDCCDVCCNGAETGDGDYACIHVDGYDCN